ncbi:MAG: AmmeMemoRadiSam system protein B [Chloroflexi bacterium RBG_16_48_8]|nr:MAG: AmmeMemoRadiSam system protein B [Chloroflexi bacterium RBG_16_48_8]
MNMTDIRPSPIAGTWYPRNPDILRQSIDAQLLAAEIPPLQGEVLGVVAPHAGHRYSGDVAAHAFKCFEGLEPEIVVVVSPLHSHYPGDVFTTEHDAYSTPLGEIPVDLELLDLLNERIRGHIVFKKIRQDSEHSLEIELPFLQRVLPHPFRLLPLMILNQTSSIAETLGQVIAQLLKGKSSLFVASSDLSHFYPAVVAREYDEAFLSRIEAFDPEGVVNAEREGVGFACGRGAIATVLWAARQLGADQVKLLRYAHSGDVTGDHHSVVGYGSALIYKAKIS